MSFACTKAVGLKSAKNLSASIISYNAAPFLRFAFDTVNDFGPSTSGKTHTVAQSNSVLVEEGNFRISLSAYRKATSANADIIKAIQKEVPSAVDGDTVGADLASKGRGFTARGNTKDGTIYIDIPAKTIATLSNPATTFKERDAVAPLSQKGNKRLLASSSGYCSLLNNELGLTMNIMLDLESSISPDKLAAALGIKVDDPLLVSLCGGAEAIKAASVAASSAPVTTVISVSAFSKSVREYLSIVSEDEVQDAVRLVFAAKIRSAVDSGSNMDGSNKQIMDMLSKLKHETVRSWVVAQLVESAVAKARMDGLVAGGDIAATARSIPASNAEVQDLFDSLDAATNMAIKAMIKSAILAELQELDAADEVEAPSTKKSRAE